MNSLTPEDQTLLSTWQQHVYAEFILKDAEAAIATMTETPYAFLIPSGTGGTGKDGVRDFYANHFLPNIPPDIELVPVSETVAQDRIVEEYVVRFTHTLNMDWLVPGVPATGRKVEFGLVIIIQFENGNVASERFYWDQATVLTQLGVLDNPLAAAGIESATKLLKLSEQSPHGLSTSN